jgi:hypothetical protein
MGAKETEKNKGHVGDEMRREKAYPKIRTPNQNLVACLDGFEYRRSISPTLDDDVFAKGEVPF